MNIDNTKNLVIQECKRIIEILESNCELKPYSFGSSTIASELKGKMAELRRDTLRLEKMVYKSYEFKSKSENGWRI